MKRIIIIVALTLFSLRLSSQEMKAWDFYTGLSFGGFSYQHQDIGSSTHPLAGISLRAIFSESNTNNGGGISLYYLFDLDGAMDANPNKQLTQIYFLISGGKVLNQGRRIQFPFYFSYGAGYSGSAESTLWFWGWGGTAQLKLYLSQRFGIFAGVDALLGVGIGNSSLGWMYNGHVYAGLIITLGS